MKTKKLIKMEFNLAGDRFGEGFDDMKLPASSTKDLNQLVKKEGLIMKNSKTLMQIEILQDADVSIQCIHALRQVMEKFNSELSANGCDRQAVYHWFVERHRIDSFKMKING